MKFKVPFYRIEKEWTAIKGQALPKISDYLSGGQYINHDVIAGFEKRFCKKFVYKHAAAVNSGTAGLKLCVQALVKHPKHTCVIIQANTFISDAYAALVNGCDLGLIDCDEYYQMCPVKLEMWLNTWRDSYQDIIIITTHMYGHPSNLHGVAQRYNCQIIEDASQAHGALKIFGGITTNSLGKKYGAIRPGTITAEHYASIGHEGVATVFSCYPTKNLGACGNAGIVVSADAEFIEKIKLLRSLGMKNKYNFEVIGWKDSIDGLQAIILQEKLVYFRQWIDVRHNAAIRYKELLSKNSKVILPPDGYWCARHAYHLFVIRVQKRDELQMYLQDKGIETLIHYPIPLNRQKVLFNSRLIAMDACRNAEKFSKEIPSLPIHSHITYAEIDYVCKKIEEFYE